MTPEEIAAEKASSAASEAPLPDSSCSGLLARINAQALPSGYDPQKHQDYVDRRLAELSETQRSRISQLWKEQQRLNPNMPNRGQCFVKIPEYVAKNERQSMKKRLVAPLFLVTVVLLGAVFTTKIPIDMDSIAGNKKAKPVRMSGKLIDPATVWGARSGDDAPIKEAIRELDQAPVCKPDDGCAIKAVARRDRGSRWPVVMNKDWLLSGVRGSAGRIGRRRRCCSCRPGAGRGWDRAGSSRARRCPGVGCHDAGPGCS